MDWHNWGAKTEAFQTYFDFSGKAVDWAVSHGASLVYSGNPKKPHYSPVDAQGNWMNIGTGVLTPLWEYGETLDNLDFRLETPAVNIIVDNGTVKGVYAQEADGIVRINAKSVIMATGGFASNVDMGKEWLRVPAERIKFMSFEGQDGDGHQHGSRCGRSSARTHHGQLWAHHHRGLGMGQSTDYLHRLVPLLARRYARCPPARRQATSLREPRRRAVLQ